MAWHEHHYSLDQLPVDNDTTDLITWYDSMTKNKKEGQFRFYLVNATLVVAFDPRMNGEYLSQTPIDTLNTLTPEQISPAQVDTENKELRLPAKARASGSTYVTFSIDGGGHAVAELQALKRRILQAESARGEADFELRRHFNAKLSAMM